MITNYTYGAINQDVQFVGLEGFLNWSAIQEVAADNPDIVNFILYIDQGQSLIGQINQSHSVVLER